MTTLPTLCPSATSRRDGAPTEAHLRELPKAAAALAALAATSAIARDGVPAWEATVFDRINNLPNAAEPLLWLPMQLGSLFGPFVVAGAAWARWRRWQPTVGAVVVGVAAWQAAKLVKDDIERGRPGDLAPAIVRRWGTPKDGLGFVSGHSAVAFSLAGVVSPYLGRRWRPVAYAMAVSVSLARIHVAAHYPLDTVGGASLGLLLAYGYNASVGVPPDTTVAAQKRR
ncbi:MAG: phosphatase PAP2 family protein [Microthrixaceae bacterium]